MRNKESLPNCGYAEIASSSRQNCRIRCWKPGNFYICKYNQDGSLRSNIEVECDFDWLKKQNGYLDRSVNDRCI